MEEIISIVCPEKHCSLAALDVVGQQHGVLNYQALRKKLHLLQSTYQQTGDKVTKLLEMLTNVEETLTNRERFKSDTHFCSERNSNGPAIHCHYYAFGKVDPSAMNFNDGSQSSFHYSCGHYHKGSCAMCEEIETFGITLESMADDESEEVKLLISDLSIDYHARRFRHYAGHQARLAHEHEALDLIKAELKVDENLLFVTADYAMNAVQRTAFISTEGEASEELLSNAR